MESDAIILRQEIYSPLTTKGAQLTSENFDDNFINVYKDLEALLVTNGVLAYNAVTVYDDATVLFATYGGRLWQWINASTGSAVTPVAGIYWQEVFPSIMAHRKNSDTILAEGTTDETTAADIRAFIDAGLTSTTNLTITTQTAISLLLNSSTGADVTFTEATPTAAGLLGGADKTKLNTLSGSNTGDQTLASLGAEATANKATDFTTVNDVLFPTVQAVATYVASAISPMSLAATLLIGNSTSGADISITAADKIDFGSSNEIGVNLFGLGLMGIKLASGFYVGTSTTDAITFFNGALDVVHSSPKIGLTDSDTNFGGQLVLPVLTADRIYTLPLTAGIIALQADTLSGGDQAIDGAGMRKVTLGGNALTDKVVFESLDSSTLLNISGDGTVWARGAGDISTNCAFGESALDANTTGLQNTAFGQNALSSTLIGSFNVAIGRGALTLATGASNTVVGANAMAGLLGAGSNTAIGFNAGRYSTGAASNNGASNSVYLGINTYAKANSETNQIVIGNTVTGNGSNTTTIGNSSIVGTFLQGAVVVGEYKVATLPTAATYQSGVINVSDEAGGYVLAFSDGTNWRRSTDRAIVS